MALNFSLCITEKRLFPPSLHPPISCLFTFSLHKPKQSQPLLLLFTSDVLISYSFSRCLLDFPYLSHTGEPSAGCITPDILSLVLSDHFP